MALLLFIDYRQWLGLGNKAAFWLTVRTGIVIALLELALLLILVCILTGFAVAQFI